MYSAALGAKTAPKILTSFSMWEPENYPEKTTTPEPKKQKQHCNSGVIRHDLEKRDGISKDKNWSE